jgi:hypothetical protein
MSDVIEGYLVISAAWAVMCVLWWAFTYEPSWDYPASSRRQRTIAARGLGLTAVWPLVVLAGVTWVVRRLIADAREPLP